MCNRDPWNNDDLVDRMEGMRKDVLDKPYVIRTCRAAWLWCAVAADGVHMKPPDIEQDEEDDG